MTNEEKIKEIASAYLQEGDGHIEQIIREDALEEIVEWKDQQSKEYLENKRKELVHKLYNEVIESPYDFGNLEGQINAISLIINKFFPNDKEQN